MKNPERISGSQHSSKVHLKVDEGYNERRETRRILPTVGQRYSEYEVNARDIAPWLDRLRLQQRLHGMEGIREVWEQLKHANHDLPVEGPVAEELWDRIILGAFESDHFLEDVLLNASNIHKRTGRSPKLYLRILTTKLQDDSSNALAWHRRVKPMLPPTVQDYQKLFEQSLRLHRNSIFESIYHDHALCPMYDNIVPKLCSVQLYDEAFRWHGLLLKAKDMPIHFSAIEPLLTHFAQLKDDQRVEQIVTSLLTTKMGRPPGNNLESKLHRFVRSPEHGNLSRELMNKQLGEIHGIAPKQLSDNFCARLFATTLFRVDTVINGLVMMGTERIGPGSLREIVIRNDFSGPAICRHLDLLTEAGISTGTSKYVTLIRQAALGNRKQLLHSIINSDAHPDTYEDLSLQERLFAMYLEQGDLPQLQRVFAVITSEVPETSLNMQKKNLYLRGHIRLRNRERVLTLLEEMKAKNIPLTPKSSRHLRTLWLSRRRVSKTSYISRTLQDIFLISQVMKQTLGAGGLVPMDAWREIIRRLGMTGKLTQCQDLLLWLADWYSSPPNAADSGRSLESSFVRLAESKRRKSNVTAIVSPPHSFQTSAAVNDLRTAPTSVIPRSTAITRRRSEPGEQEIQHHHLERLFPRAAQQAIIAWGFQHAARQPRRDERQDWTWGLRLLRELRERGVPIRREEVAKACKHRLAQLFGTKWPSKRRVNRTAKRLNDQKLAQGDRGAMYGSYIRRMEEIWGSGLFVVEKGGLGEQKAVQVHAPCRRRGWRIDRVASREGTG